MTQNEPSTDPEHQRVTDTTPARRPRVLIVDDEATNRKLLVDLVAREGFETAVASGGAEALALLLRETFDVVLLDLMMPDVDGLAVLAELQRRGALPALSVVVVTAHTDRKVRLEALAAGVSDVLFKPVDRLEVAHRLRTFVELKRLRENAVTHVTRALRKSDHLLRRSFEQSPVAKITWDPGLHVTDWNAAAERLFGYARAEALGQHADFIVPARVMRAVEEVRQRVLSGTAADSTNENVTKDGRTIVCEWHNAPLTDADGEVMGVSSVVLDVTDRVRLQTTLAQSQKMDAIGRLAGGIAHDFNNLLAVILGFAGLVRDELPEGDRRRDNILEVLKAGERGAGLTRQLLTFSRLQPSERRPTDLSESLAEIQRLLARTVGEHIELSVAPSTRPIVARIDPVQFDQVVMNLAVNARDAMPAGGRLHLALEQDPGPARWIRLTVKDTGVGMDEATQLRLFEPFFTTKAKDKGTGLGLATVLGIVEDAGGTVRVKSAPGSGTTFMVELPPCDEQVERREDPVPERAGRGETVLVAEDEPSLRKLTARALEGAGYAVRVASDGNEALRIVDELGPRLDVLLTDVVMPGCSGYDVAERAARVAPGSAVLVTSGYLDEAVDRSRLRNRPILWKPVLPRDLVRAVGEALVRRDANGTTPAAPAGGVVLVVADDEAARKALVRMLAAAGYATQVAATVAAARESLQRGPAPRFVFCDLSLPDDAGADLLTWIQSAFPALCPRVLVLTGSVTDAAARRLLASGTFRVVPKPIDPRRLLDVLAGAG